MISDAFFEILGLSFHCRLTRRRGWGLQPWGDLPFSLICEIALLTRQSFGHLFGGFEDLAAIVADFGYIYIVVRIDTNSRFRYLCHWHDDTPLEKLVVWFA